MSKPIYLREETWLFLLQALAKLQGKTSVVLQSIGYTVPDNHDPSDNDILLMLAEQPGPFLLYAGILNYPSLLQGTIVELPDGREIFINLKTAQALRKKEDFIVATEFSTHESKEVSRSEVILSLREGMLFDQISRKMVLSQS
jgi:hypothetical protein